MSLKTLREMSNRYGSDPRYVLAGGGNTSWKDGATLYVKGSGAALATIQEEQFVALDRNQLAAIWQNTYPEDFDAREAAALADLMNSRIPGENGRPSVETLLHDILPYRFVCHLHPGAVNALTCAKDGKSAAAKLFPGTLWVDAIMPGYVLAAEMKRQLDAVVGDAPQVIFIENHGVFVAGDTVEAIDALYGELMEKLTADTAEVADGDFFDERAAAIAPRLRMLLWENGASYLRFAPLAFASQEEMEKGLILTLSPDHMVYCGGSGLFVTPEQAQDTASLRTKVATFAKQYGVLPRVIAVAGVGVFASGGTIASCDAAYDLMLNSAEICKNAETFGGAKSMPQHLVDVMSDWEVERYRKGRVTADAQNRAMGKIAIVTGAAQGFGAGIALGLAQAGAAVVLGDLNFDGAHDTASDIAQACGAGKTMAVSCDVTNEDDVEMMIRACVLRYGGLDVMVSNAGIVRPGSLSDLSLDDFHLSTEVNYTAFFLCAKQAAAVMKVQREAKADHFADIVQINSKSGLSGSNKNFAYAGAKFGGIGLVQSFALELAPFGVKVNAVCPGNFLEGPMWSDPERGLFVQYLRAGKVPGAKTVDDVRAHYEAQTPLGRGCRVVDVTRAILYLLEQEYETGQALPVTGGQEMLH